VSRLVAAELLKLRTTRTFVVIVAVSLGLVALASVLALALGHFESQVDVASVLSNSGSAGLLILILGVIGMAGEYRHGTIGPTFLVTPARWRVVVAKAAAYALAGLAVGLAATLLGAVIALPWLSAKGVDVSLSGADLSRIFFGGLLYSAVSGAMGVGLGALMRNQIAAVVVVFVVLFIADPLVSGAFSDYGKYSPSGVSLALTTLGAQDGAPFEEIVPFWAAALLYCGYAASLVGSGILLVTRRDVL